METILSSYEGTQPKGYLVRNADSIEWKVIDDTGLVDCGWEPIEFEWRARRDCKRSFNEVVEAGK